MREQQNETCQECGQPLDEETKKYCEKPLCLDCAITISAGETAHEMAEKIRKQKQNQSKP